MRFDRSVGLTAEQVVNRYNEKDLADVIFQNGEEPRSRVIARAIIAARKNAPITTTTRLAEIIAGTTRRKTGIHPATLAFQGLRIHVNRELEVLENALNGAVESLKKGGRIAVISYHSLEDRIVKNVFRHYSKNCICPKEILVCQCEFRKKLYLLTKRPIIPNGIEVQSNPRARSAKLRVAERI
jgi:16S rRNA (cytosine1402-N4)-methyltransferase